MSVAHSKWIYHLMVCVILCIFALTFYSFLQIGNELSNNTGINGKNGDPHHLARNTWKFKFITIVILVLCIILILCVWVVATHSGAGSMIRLSQTVDRMRNNDYAKPVNVTGTGALGVLEESIEKLREELKLQHSRESSSANISQNGFILFQTLPRKILRLAVSTTIEDLIKYFGELLLCLQPPHKYYLFLLDRAAGTISGEPFIIPYDHENIVFRKCGTEFFDRMYNANEPFSMQEYIRSYNPKTGQEKSELEHIRKLEQTLGIKTVFPIPVHEGMRYLLATDLDQGIPEHIDILESINQVIYLLSIRLKKYVLDQAGTGFPAGQMLNFHEFLVNARQMLPAVRESGQSMAFIFIAVDYFSTVIETYGNNIASQLLAHLGELILSNTRASDHVGKFSNEIYIVNAVGLSSDELVQYGEKIRQMLETYPFQYDEDCVMITVSIGGATARHDLNENEEYLLKRARSMLDKAITSGGNTTCF